MVHHPRRHARAEAIRKAWLAQAARWPAEPWPGDDETVQMDRNDTQASGYTPKLPADHPLYKQRVAEPTMEAVDGLPAAYRDCVHQYGYIDVYRAWKRRWPVARIVDVAERNGGVFVL